MIRKRRWQRSAEHRRFIQQMNCANCGERRPSEAAHIRKGSDGALGRKPSDRFLVPLCTHCHAQQHAKGEDSFWSGRDPQTLAAKLWALSRKHEGADLLMFGAYALRQWRGRN